MEEATYIILTITKVREEMNKKINVFCANVFMQKGNFKVRMYHMQGGLVRLKIEGLVLNFKHHIQL